MRNLAFYFRKIPVTRILAFHDIPDYLGSEFRAKITALKGQANIISLDDFFSGRISWRKINVALTFDDGYRSWIDNVAPVLKALGVTATFFVSSGFIGLRGTQETYFLRETLRSTWQTTGSLNAESLRELAGQGFTIGGHTMHHVDLGQVCRANELRREIQEDRKELERITGARVRYFSYPFGFHRRSPLNLERMLQESGYRGAVTVDPGFNTMNTNRFCLHRDLVDASLPSPVFVARFLGNYDPVIVMRRALGLSGENSDS
jgi:peptidoglycan/xylan/chitin deacetylase (PgdA/CDA1 family)